jgi:hypothetical protein
MSSFESFQLHDEQDSHMSSGNYKAVVHAHELVFCILGVVGAELKVSIQDVLTFYI